jgi:hypothetical protein
MMTDTNAQVIAMLPRIEYGGAEQNSQRRLYDVVRFSVGSAGKGDPELAHWLERVRELSRVDASVLEVATAELDLSMMHGVYEAYLDGEKAAEKIRSFLKPKVPFLTDTSAHGKRVWLHLAARELEEVPWELLAWNPNTESRTLFFRGLPTRLLPLFSVGATPLRTVFVTTPHAESYTRSFCGPSDLIVASGTRELERLRDYDVVHIVANARVGSAYESHLLLGPEPLLATQLGRMLFGSRVGLLVLSPAPNDTRESYRAFTHLGGEGFQCSIVAPVGPLGQDDQRFWAMFHKELHGSGSVERALRNTRGGRAASVCFYLRHRNERVFSRSELPPPESFPTNAGAVPQSTGSLSAQQDILERTLANIAAVDATYGSGRQNAALSSAKKQAAAMKEQLDMSTGEEEE